MIVLALLITVLYCTLIGAFILGFTKVEEFNPSAQNVVHSFSIIIPFRDEEGALPGLLESINLLDYPSNMFEIIFVDDESEDSSVAMIKRFFASAQNDIVVLTNNRKTRSPKKDAIHTAIKHAKYDWVITTDADCRLQKKWLSMFDSFIQKHQPEFIVAPVCYNNSKTFLHRFQVLDLLSLQGAAIGGFGIGKPFLCNGANLCYSKQFFQSVNGFEGNINIASGDDIFLLEKALKNYPDKLAYLKSKQSIVHTRSQPTFRDLVQQRIRWAAKSSRYSNTFSKVVALSVLGMNALLILLLVVSFLGYFSWLYLTFIFGSKLLFDAILIYKSASFFDQKNAMVSCILSSFVYPFFSMFVVITSLSSGYQWKGRQFKQ